MAASHVGIITDPSADAVTACGKCHGGKVNDSMTSLHSSFRGYTTLFQKRSGISLDSDHHLAQEFKNECGKCHTTCGQCHISFPNSVDGGLIQGHRFMPIPSQSDNCISCHGSRVGEEYTGSRSGYSADVHYVPNGMNCMDCHSGREMHGNGIEYATRYETPDIPRCEDCHDVSQLNNPWHEKHGSDFQCNICHSQDYKNCNSCHVGGAGISEPSYIKCKIGKNPLPEIRDYKYVLLRHIPVTEETFSPWGITDLPDYESLPTWKYASPHNIRLWTARTDTTEGKSCGQSCHSTPDIDGWFLRQADLDSLSQREATANEAYVLPNGNPEQWE